MALNDILPLTNPPFGEIGTRKWAVAANSSGNGTDAAGTYAKAFRSGEPVLRALGGAVVTPLYTTTDGGNTAPVVATDHIVGIAASTSTETETAAGTVEVIPLVPGQTWLIAPKVAATFGQTQGAQVQSTYDALVGDRVLIDLVAGSYSAGAYTILAADSTTYGCMIMPMNVFEHPGKVAIAFRDDVSDLNA